jgi:endogenous inhibitor of DNA gyrase (YacG/DUF329 family)
MGHIDNLRTATCRRCGREFAAGRAGTYYCSARCKQAEWRAKRRANAVKSVGTVSRDLVQPEPVTSVIPEPESTESVTDDRQDVTDDGHTIALTPGLVPTR